MTQTAEYTLEKKSVNNKTLFNEIHAFTEEGIVGADIAWANDVHRESFVAVMEDMLWECASNELIDQYNVISDMRNNTIRDMDRGVYTVEISYRQKNCLNTTRLIYTIKDLLVNKIKKQLDLELLP